MLSTTARVAVMALPALVQALSISPSPYEVTISGRVSTIQIPIPQLRTFTTTITQASTTVTQTNAIAESIETTTIVLTGAVPVVTSIAGLIPQSARLAASSVAPGPVVPVTVSGFVTSITLPAAAAAASPTIDSGITTQTVTQPLLTTSTATTVPSQITTETSTLPLTVSTDTVVPSQITTETSTLPLTVSTDTVVPSQITTETSTLPLTMSTATVFSSPAVSTTTSTTAAATSTTTAAATSSTAAPTANAAADTITCVGGGLLGLIFTALAFIMA